LKQKASAFAQGNELLHLHGVKRVIEKDGAILP